MFEPPGASCHPRSGEVEIGHAADAARQPTPRKGGAAFDGESLSKIQVTLGTRLC